MSLAVETEEFCKNASNVGIFSYLHDNKIVERQSHIPDKLRNMSDSDYELFRTMECKDAKYLFALDIEWPRHSAPDILSGLKASYAVAKKVNLLHPEQFYFTISGRGFHAFSYVDSNVISVVNANKLAKLIAYNTSYPDFFCASIYRKSSLIRAIGSYNRKASLYDVPVELASQLLSTVIKNAQRKVLRCADIPALDVDSFDFSALDYALEHSHKIDKSSLFALSDTISVCNNANKSCALEIAFLPYCVKLLFNPNIYKSHMLRLLVACYFKDAIVRVDRDYRKLSHSEISDLFRYNIPLGDYDESGTFKHFDREKILTYIFKHSKYSVPSCQLMKLHGFCIEGCSRKSLLD